MSGSVLSIARPAAAATNGHSILAKQLNCNGNGTSGGAAKTTVASAITPPKQPQLAAKVIQQSQIICFDVDSTVICEEGIDELAEYCGKGSEVARVTKEAMGGAMTFQDALKIRLNIIQPTQQQVRDFIAERPSTLTKNVKRFVSHLKAEGKQVYLVSGGFDCLIAPVATELGIPLANVYANKMLFDYLGNYDSFDISQPTSRSGGKAEAISIIKQRYNEDSLITMIGDGATDLEAVPPANYFIGFGGNVVRPEVYRRAQYYVTDFEQLMGQNE
ncbi:uncharacterized protein Dana_GF10695 [Drosophila ananassae]|uniref:Phosphoserine phosphatase n=2 Tax=melanogaster group TaxID=32346 RepID=B3M6G1_DROAN|nr:phosphoserine phosphatase [Drosophila ananassae]EDV40810.1 uncharacterized protein Dana_GF10695 [Drosophila ananassae]